MKYCPECNALMVNLYYRENTAFKNKRTWRKINHSYCKICNKIDEELKLISIGSEEDGN